MEPTTAFRRAVRTTQAACVVAIVVVAAACSSGAKADPHGATPKRETTTTTAVPVKFTMTPAAGSTHVPLDAPITVSSADGTLSAVAITSGKSLVAGVTAPGAASWTSTGSLLPATTYRVKVTGQGVDQKPTKANWTFTTLKPTDELHTTINVGAGHAYGVGLPIIVQLNHAIAAEKRAEVTKRLTVTAPAGVVGAWRWSTAQELHWRPSVYWPANSAVNLKVDFAGLDAGNGVWGVDGRNVDFKIGNAQVSYVDTAAHNMTVTSNGQVLRTLPVSTGREQYPTKSGIHVVNEKMATLTMDSSSVGIPRDSANGYYEEVKWDVRISNSGEFVHAAPWSTSDQGSQNVSHGCVNLSDADGQWFYNLAQVGDVVQVTGSPEQLKPDNGYGDWQIPWAQWAN